MLHVSDKTYQRKYSPSSMYGVANIDGEGIERNWSKFSPFIGMPLVPHSLVVMFICLTELAGKTQHMSHGKRREFITHKATAINIHIVEQLPGVLEDVFDKLKGGN